MYGFRQAVIYLTGYNRTYFYILYMLAADKQ